MRDRVSKRLIKTIKDSTQSSTTDTALKMCYVQKDELTKKEREEMERYLALDNT